jgi:hypothetical protein
MLITAAALALAVVPAAAQQSGSQQKGSTSAEKSGQRGQVNAMSQDKLRKNLQDAGFKDIEIVDAAYVVHARTSEGNMVVMYIDPPSAMSRPGKGTTGSSPSGSSGAGQQQSK